MACTRERKPSFRLHFGIGMCRLTPPFPDCRSERWRDDDECVLVLSTRADWSRENSKLSWRCKTPFFLKLHVLVLIEVVGRNISWNVYGCFTSAMIPYSFLFFPSLNTYFCCLWTISVSCNTVSVLENVVHVATRACVRLLSVNCNDYSNLSLTMLRSPFFFYELSIDGSDGIEAQRW